MGATPTAVVSPFLTWFSSWGNVIFVAAQVAFWAAVAFAAVSAALSYKRLVDKKVGVAAKTVGEAVKIDEFVE
ncbi:MAG: hypothetical protein Q8S43_01920 [Actinomycetota bacterium]|nr:MAG: hypothetical protein FD171_474 [Actinomycetota bacterium]MDO8950788.1 hypothetical protein [Actinomycetota bacterium]MDP3629699.1 hypothetical protein [Actinomycetota bacterium]